MKIQMWRIGPELLSGLRTDRTPPGDSDGLGSRMLLITGESSLLAVFIKSSRDGVGHLSTSLSN